MEGDVRDELLPVAETWVVEQDGELVGLHVDHRRSDRRASLIRTTRERATAASASSTPDCSTTRSSSRCSRPTTKPLASIGPVDSVDHEARVDEESGLPQLILRLEYPS